MSIRNVVTGRGWQAVAGAVLCCLAILAPTGVGSAARAAAKQGRPPAGSTIS
jgi:hypothetical protein